MTKSLNCLHMNHLNAVIQSFDESVAHFEELLGAQFNFDLPGDHWHGYLMTIGGVMFQFFEPAQYILNARMGPHYVGIEYQVPDVEEARQEVFARGFKIVRELDVAFHMHPDGVFGVCWEFFDKSFQDRINPPVDYPEAIWDDEKFADHPIGFLGLKRYSVVVEDLPAAVEFAQSFLGATVSYREERDGAKASAVGLALGGTVLELLSPTGEGAISRFHARYGDGIRSTVFAVKNLEATARYFADRGITLQAGDAPGSLALSPHDNLGLLLEFSE